MVADIPGLVEGAHQGKGLGIQFLKHIERTQILIHLLDFSLESPRDPLVDYRIIRDELEKFSLELSLKPQILVANKVDHPEAEEKFVRCREKLKEIDSETRVVSSLNGKGIPELLNCVRRILQKLEFEENATELETP